MMNMNHENDDDDHNAACTLWSSAVEAATTTTTHHNDGSLTKVTNQPWYDTFHQQSAIYNGTWDDFHQQPHDGYGTAIYDSSSNNNKTDDEHHQNTLTNPQIASYRGYFTNGMFQGTEGHCIYTNGDVYVGDFVQSARHGQGTYAYHPNHHTAHYTGAWQQNIRHGHGTLTYRNNDYYEGEFQNGQRHGYGIFVWVSTQASYQGQWEDGLYHGTGTLVDHITNTRYVGQLEQGQKHGVGQVTNLDGTVILETGCWDRGTKIIRCDPPPAATTNLTTVGASTRITNDTGNIGSSRPTRTNDHYGYNKDTVVAIMTTMFQASTPFHTKDDNDDTNANGSLTTTAFQPESQPRPPPPSYPPPPPPPDEDDTTTTTPTAETAATAAVMETNAADCRAVVNQRVTDIDGYSGIYTGIVWSDTNRPHGVGKIRYDNYSNHDRCCIYEGFWRHGSKEGHGRNLFLPQQDLYIGEYRYNVRNGYGQYFWKDGRTYDGHYKNDQKHGHGIFRYPNGESYIG